MAGGARLRPTRRYPERTRRQHCRRDQDARRRTHLQGGVSRYACPATGNRVAIPFQFRGAVECNRPGLRSHFQDCNRYADYRRHGQQETPVTARHAIDQPGLKLGDRNPQVCAGDGLRFACIRFHWATLPALPCVCQSKDVLAEFVSAHPSTAAPGYNPLVAIRIALAGGGADLIKMHDTGPASREGRADTLDEDSSEDPPT